MSETNGRLSGAQILALEDLPVEDVEVPEWRTTVRVRTLTGTERDQYEESLVVYKTQGKKQTREMRMANARAKLVALTAVDESGARLFSADEVVRLGGKNAAALDRLFSAAMRLAGLTEADVEDLSKNSASADPSGASTSG